MILKNLIDLLKFKKFKIKDNLSLFCVILEEPFFMKIFSIKTSNIQLSNDNRQERRIKLI